MFRSTVTPAEGGERRRRIARSRAKLREKREGSFLRGRRIAVLPGQYFDMETGLYQNGRRDYDPSTGRYLQSDPIGLRGGLSTYGYALQAPTRYADPTGLEAPCVTLGTTCVENHPTKAGIIGTTIFAAVVTAGFGLVPTAVEAVAACDLADAAAAARAAEAAEAAKAAELARLQQVEYELRAQLDNGKAQLARELASGRRLEDLGGLRDEVMKDLPAQIEDVIRRINDLSN